MDEQVKNILENYYLYNYKFSSDNNPVKNVFFQNDRYLKISYNKNFWNFIDLMGFNFNMYDNKLFLQSDKKECKFFATYTEVLKINNLDPWQELMRRRNYYYLTAMRNNSIEVVRIKCPDFKYSFSNNFKKINKDVYIKIENLESINLPFLESLFDVKVENLFIDLRGNQGGSVSKSIMFLEYFIPNGQTIFLLQSRKEIYKVTSKEEKSISFKGIYILIDENTISSAELIAKSLKYNFPNTVFIGSSKTGGKNVVTNIFKTKSYYLKVPQFRHYFNNDLDDNRFIFPDLQLSQNILNENIKEWSWKL